MLLRMQAASTPEAGAGGGSKIAQEMLSAARPMVQGVQVSAPFGRYALAADVIAGVLDRPERQQGRTIEGSGVGKRLKSR